MKFLIIKDGKAEYRVNSTMQTLKQLDQISKEDLFNLIELCITEESFEMDPYDEGLLKNKAHQIIYKNIYYKLEELKRQRVRFTDEKIALYRTAINQYSADLSDNIDE